MTYAEKLQTEEWFDFRDRLIAKAENRCTECGFTGGEVGPLQIHHVIYIRRREPWEYPDELCLVLCESCHLNRQVHDEEAQVEFARMCARKRSFEVYEISKNIRRSLDKNWAPKVHDAFALIRRR